MNEAGRLYPASCSLILHHETEVIVKRPVGQFFNDCWKSISDFRFYSYVAKQPFGAAIRHFLKMTVLVGTICSILMVTQMIFMNRFLTWCRDNLPEITISEGNAAADVPQPYVAQRDEAGRIEFTVVIDTTGETTQLDEDYVNGILVRKNGVVFRFGKRTMEHVFPETLNVTIDRAYYESIIFTPLRIAGYVAAVYLILGVVWFLQSLFITSLTYTVAMWRRAGCLYRMALNISLYALTPAVCFLMAIVLLGVGLHPLYACALYLIIHVAFAIGAVISYGASRHAV